MAPSGPTAAHPLLRLLPVLYSFRRCPYAMRARLALAARGMGLLKSAAQNLPRFHSTGSSRPIGVCQILAATGKLRP